MDEVTAKLYINVVAHDVFEASIGDETEFGSSARIKAAWPTGDNALDLRVDLTLNSGDHPFAPDSPESFDLLGNRNA
jgi:hypothetical protein